MAHKRASCPPSSADPPAHRGRPRAQEPGTSLSTWVPSSEYDRLVKLAAKSDQSLSRLVREWLKRR